MKILDDSCIRELDRIVRREKAGSETLGGSARSPHTSQVKRHGGSTSRLSEEAETIQDRELNVCTGRHGNSVIWKFYNKGRTSLNV